MELQAFLFTMMYTPIVILIMGLYCVSDFSGEITRNSLVKTIVFIFSGVNIAINMYIVYKYILIGGFKPFFILAFAVWNIHFYYNSKIKKNTANLITWTLMGVLAANAMLWFVYLAFDILKLAELKEWLWFSLD